MSNKSAVKPLTLALGTVLTVSLANTTISYAADNPFSMKPLASGYLLLAEGKRYEEAAVYLEKAAEGMPQRARVRYNLGLLLQYLGRDREAEGELLEAVDIEPDNMDFLYAATDYYLKRGRLGEARRIAETMVAKHPSNRLGHDLLNLIKSKE